ncbi:Putative membrane protein (plasmid) [Sphingopyxis fribergensis]|uniref:Putative membrane protein n=1 Tax=Sphingopyxis fribergensis TaxID=1515612 RepID=A0A0A7PP17_9SPHN|nr:Putative membrane protein [Sphingopyxis fribergensis]
MRRDRGSDTETEDRRRNQYNDHAEAHDHILADDRAGIGRSGKALRPPPRSRLAAPVATAMVMVHAALLVSPFVAIAPLVAMIIAAIISFI